MNEQIPKLILDNRTLISRGADFLCFRLKVKTELLPDGVADRLETWKRVAKKSFKRTIENYVIETNARGTKRMVPTWEDNFRLAKIDGAIYELLSSKSAQQWR